MQTDFLKKLTHIRQKNQSDLALLIAPQVERMPLAVRSYDDPFLPFGRLVVNATSHLVCAYVFDLASYLALGAAGAIALERTIGYVNAELVTILHAPFASPTFASLVDERSFGVDALTLVDNQHTAAYLTRPDRMAFVMRNGASQTHDAPDDVGFYWRDADLFTLLGKDGEVISIHLLAESSLGVGYGDDFAEQLKHSVEQMRDR